MLPLITSQAIALSRAKSGRAKPTAEKSAAEGQVRPQPASRAPARMSFLWRVLDAVAAARLRRAEIEIRYHRQLCEDILKDEPSRSAGGGGGR
jgi:hypothetical protein